MSEEYVIHGFADRHYLDADGKVYAITVDGPGKISFTIHSNDPDAKDAADHWIHQFEGTFVKIQIQAI